MDDDALCPSARCEPDAILLGVVAADGRVAYLTPEVRIDQEFVARASRGREPERRFRFAQPCGMAACGHWTAGHCGLVEHAVGELAGEGEPSLPHCSIRKRCRWYAEQGRGACQVCPRVVRNVG